VTLPTARSFAFQVRVNKVSLAWVLPTVLIDVLLWRDAHPEK
jgi:hypothetical protein